MRHLLLAGLMLIGAASAAQQPPAERAIRDVLDAQAAAWNRGDIPGYMNGYWRSDSTVFVSGGSRTAGFDSVLARYRRGYAKPGSMGTLTFEEVAVRLVTPAFAVVSGVWRLKRTGDMPWGRFTLLFERKGEAWRVTYDHTSSAAN